MDQMTEADLLQAYTRLHSYGVPTEDMPAELIIETVRMLEWVMERNWIRSSGAPYRIYLWWMKDGESMSVGLGTWPPDGATIITSSAR